MLSAQAVGNAAAIVRRAAEAAGRDPTQIRIVSAVIVAPDLTADEERGVVGVRAVTYLQAQIGSLLAQLNGWDVDMLRALRAHPSIHHLDGEIASQTMTRDQLLRAAESLPEDWLRDGAVAGTARYCADRILEYLQAGADEILLHGTPPSGLAGLAAEMRRTL
jgi:5,10-methylenetetrahydromethanopterin reductase